MCEVKTCKICNESKPLNQFDYRKQRGTYINKCKKCRKLKIQTISQDEMAVVIERKKLGGVKVCSVCNQEKDLKRYKYDYERKVFMRNCMDCKVMPTKEEMENRKSKICKMCKEDKPLSEYKPIKNSLAYRTYCNTCDKIRHKQYYENNIEKVNKYREENRAILLAKSKIRWANKTPEEKLLFSKKTLINRNKNKDNYLEKRRLNTNKRLKTDIAFRMNHLICGRLRHAIKKGKKTRSSIDYLGMKPDDFRMYFQSLFTEGMTWDLFLQGEIHIDHIIPCSKHDLSDETERIQCFHWSNLQPLWKHINMYVKRDRLDYVQKSA